MRKNIYTLIFAMALGRFAMAQIPNRGFENWTNQGSYSTPDGWSTTDTGYASYSFATAFQGAPGDSGKYYLKLVTRDTTFFGISIPAIPGIAYAGKSKSAKPGFAIAWKPASLQGNWQYAAGGKGDTGYILVGLTKWNTTKNKRDTVGYALQHLSGSVTSWQSFAIPITYLITTENPDSGSILLSSSSLDATKAVKGSYLSVDNLLFSSSSMAGINSSKSDISDFSIYPNPASKSANIRFVSEGLQNRKIQVIDMEGRIMQEQYTGEISGNYNTIINTSSLASGMYFIKITGSQSVQLNKLIIQ